VRSGRHFVDQQPPACHEQLNPEYSDVLHFFGQAGGKLPGLPRQGVRDSRWDYAGLEDSISMPVLGGWKRGDIAVGAASENDGKLALQNDTLLENAGYPPQTLERKNPVLFRFDQRLSLTIIAKPTRLE
jgi:hypothetical protein